MTYVVLDLETTTKKAYGRTGNPFFNKVVAAAVKSPEYQYAWILDKNPEEILTHISSYATVLVGHNIKYDLLYLWKCPELQRLFQNGLTIWCTQLAEYILAGQQDKFASLRRIAVEKYNCSSRDKLMESYWEQGIDTDKIPHELILTDVLNDVLDTEKIYKQQLMKAKELGMLTLIKKQMDALLATTEIEWNGMRVERDVLQENKRQLKEQLEIAERELQKLVQPYWKAA